MLGEKCYELVKEIQRFSRGDGSLPPFNDEALRSVLEEMRALYEQNRADVAAMATEDDDEDSETGQSKFLPGLCVRHAALGRNKRCVLAYLVRRVQHARRLRWELGGMLPPEARAGLSDDELAWFRSYNQALVNYMKSVGSEPKYRDLDITQHRRPPKSLYIEVRCLTDYGELELGDRSVILLKKDHQHFLLRDECEQLISQGVLEHVTPS